MKYLFALFIIGIIGLFVLSGCTQSNQIVGGDKDEHGCIPSAGYSWCEEKQKCLRTWEESCGADTTEHICTEEESLATACTADYSPVCGKSILNSGNVVYQTFSNGCSACAAMKVVSYVTGECLKEIPIDSCSDQKGNSMTLTEAIALAKPSECGDNMILECSCPEGYVKDGESCNPGCYYSTPQCGAPSVQCEKTYFCNEGTGTYWIDLNLEKEGCNPACVINVEEKSAEINWRCTGLII